MLYLNEIKKDFKGSIGLNLIKRGSTSVIYEHPVHNSMVQVYTLDKAKVKWFEEYKSRFGFRFIESKAKGSAYDEFPQEIHSFVLKKMFPLDEESKKYIKENVLSLFDEQKGKLNANIICLMLAQQSKDKKLKDLFFRLRTFVENNTVQFDLRLDSFMQMQDGSIVCTDPFYSTR